ncbi:MAG: sigma-54-dependent Fis family transcriptional regulator [Nitrospinae bacterium]|nr:sigma-54-dependent Fis family transcriptional regulator [Nitrospinota bacterium]
MGNYEAAVLIVDDDEVALLTLGSILKLEGFQALTARNGLEALNVLERESVDMIIADQKMPHMDGPGLLKEMKKRGISLPFIMLTGHGTIDMAVAMMKDGATDYMIKPFEPLALVAAVRRNLEFRRLNEENVKLKSQLKEQYSFHNIVTQSALMKRVLETTEKVAAALNTTVAIYGESGTGKEVLARAIHFSGPRMANNFVAVNCAGIPSTLLESELFGHVKGAFTGADRERDGKFGLAQKGTILLDEIGDMPMDLQVKLLRVLQERVYEKVGSNQPIKADFRIIVSTNRNLEEMVGRGSFRADLFHRISSFPITLPPLRERKEDIPLLARHFLDHLREELGKPLPGLSEKAMEKLLGYGWPGNIRELKNCLERAAILTEGELIQPKHLIINEDNDRAAPGGSRPGHVHLVIDLPEEGFSMEKVTDEVLKLALEKCGGNKSKAADLLKLDRSIFYRRL